MSIFRIVSGWFRYGGTSLGDGRGVQGNAPSSNLVADVSPVGVDSALQISAVWAACSLLTRTISTLPLMVYATDKGERELARDSALWELFHENPNSRMTPAEFWAALILNLLLRGNAYARIVRNANGEAYALWPMAADQVEMDIGEDGRVVYLYRIGNDIAALAAENVLHIKEMGNGSIGLARLDYMKVTTGELANAQAAANKLFKNNGKPTGVLMMDQVLSQDRRKKLLSQFAEMAEGSTARLYLLEADMKYQQINLSPEDMQLLSTRQFGIQEIGRWFGVPAILLNQTENTSTLGSSSGEIIESFHKLTVRPSLVFIEQAIRKRVLTAEQRRAYTIEFNYDALLRATLKDRMGIYSQGVQNGIMSRAEARQLENWPFVDGSEILTAQTNLAPLNMLGKIKGGGGNVPENTIAQ